MMSARVALAEGAPLLRPYLLSAKAGEQGAAAHVRHVSSAALTMGCLRLRHMPQRLRRALLAPLQGPEGTIRDPL